MSARIGSRILMMGAAALLLWQPAFGQGRGGATTTPPAGGGAGTSPGSVGASPTTGRSTTPTPNITTPTPTNQPTQPPPPIFVNGRVMMEDGTVPDQQVTIERVCNGTPHAEGYTDSKGYFSIELGNPRGVLQDASESDAGNGQFGSFGSNSGGFPQSTPNALNTPRDPYMRFMNCELRARLPGYRSQSVMLAGRRPMEDPNIGTILLHRTGPSEGTTVSATSLNAPKDARKAFERGLEAAKKNKPDEAMKDYQKAVELYPKYAAAWSELGKIQTNKGQAEEARKSFQAAVTADSKFVSPYLQLSALALHAQNWKDAAEASEHAVKLDPFDYPQAFFYNAIANFNLKNYDAAEKSVREAERLDTRHQIPRVSHLMGILLAQRGEYDAAAEQLRTYLKLAPAAEDAATVRSQLEKLTAQAAAAKQQ